MPAISPPNSRAMSSVRTSESSTTSCSSAAEMVALSSSCSARIRATAMLWETKSSPDIRFWPRCADALKRRARSMRSRSSRSECRSSTALRSGARSGKVQELVPRDDHVIVERQVEEPPRGDELLGDRLVLSRRRRIATRVVVHYDDPGRSLHDGGAKDLP